MTCGAPVCEGATNTTDAGGTCTASQKAGNPCSIADQQCDPNLGCGQKLMCADHQLDKFCPVSNRSKKQDIRYLGQEDLERLADEVAKVRLTTYTYRDPALGADQHLGFIIEDNTSSPAVYPNHHQVDLYGYASMAVATLQVQEQRLKAQQNQVEELQREIATLRAELRASHDPACRQR